MWGQAPQNGDRDPHYEHKEPKCEDRDPPKRPYMGTWGQEDPNMGTGTPDMGTRSPCMSLYGDIGTGTPSMGTRNPNVRTGIPPIRDTDHEDPNMGTGTPDMGTGIPCMCLYRNIGTGRPQYGDRDP